MTSEAASPLGGGTMTVRVTGLAPLPAAKTRLHDPGPRLIVPAKAPLASAARLRGFGAAGIAALTGTFLPARAIVKLTGGAAVGVAVTVRAVFGAAVPAIAIAPLTDAPSAGALTAIPVAPELGEGPPLTTVISRCTFALVRPVFGSNASRPTTFVPGRSATVTANVPLPSAVTIGFSVSPLDGDARAGRRHAAHRVAGAVIRRHRACRVDDDQLRRAGEDEELPADVGEDREHQHGEQHGRDGALGDDEAAPAADRDRTRGRCERRALAAADLRLQPIEVDEVFRVEPQVDAVVAEEALRVHRTRQVPVLACLEGGEVAAPDLRVALHAVEVDALRLAGGAEHLAQLVARAIGHASSSSGATSPPQPSGVTSTSRKRLPSAGPTIPRSSIWSRTRAARA